VELQTSHLAHRLSIATDDKTPHKKVRAASSSCYRFNRAMMC